MGSLQLLETLPPVPRMDTREERARWPREAQKHPGKMRLALARSALAWAHRQPNVPPGSVGDPMMGIGTTLMAAAERGWRATGMELDERWYRLALAGLSEYRLLAHGHHGDSGGIDGLLPRLAVILTSPEFPNAHPCGASTMQKGLLEGKSTQAGTEMSGRRSPWYVGYELRPERVEAWERELGRVLRPWCAALEVGGLCLVHVKQYVAGGLVVEVDEWVTHAAAEHLPMMRTMGYLSAPLAYHSHYQEWRRHPLQAVRARVPVSGGQRLDREELACGHWRLVPPDRVLVKNARCRQCSPLDSPEILEERIVVLRRVAHG